MDEIEMDEPQTRLPMKRQLIAVGVKTYEELKAVCEIEDCSMSDFIRLAIRDRVKSVQDRHLERALKQKSLGVK